MITYAECECMIYESHSLKEKRAVLQRVMITAQTKISMYRFLKSDIRMYGSGRGLPSSLWLLPKERVKERLSSALKFIDSFPEWERLDNQIESL